MDLRLTHLVRVETQNLGMVYGIGGFNLLPNYYFILNIQTYFSFFNSVGKFIYILF